MSDIEYYKRESESDQVCIDYAAGTIDRPTARARLIALGFDAGIVDDGLDEQDAAREKIKPEDVR